MRRSHCLKTPIEDSNNCEFVISRSRAHGYRQCSVCWPWTPSSGSRYWTQVGVGTQSRCVCGYWNMPQTRPGQSQAPARGRPMGARSPPHRRLHPGQMAWSRKFGRCIDQIFGEQGSYTARDVHEHSSRRWTGRLSPQHFDFPMSPITHSAAGCIE